MGIVPVRVVGKFLPVATLRSTCQGSVAELRVSVF
ncbi:hypothetical protein C5167_010802 [Papaver somniferum]|uniref:Uncharacterized protein n=1 Tax=Papaver somniferum TaxID=3469 RepID=A0A4Y7K582_PAPSO|nr:hypothetical protein C5167_010802 [Papaver somniferum]